MFIHEGFHFVGNVSVVGAVCLTDRSKDCPHPAPLVMGHYTRHLVNLLLIFCKKFIRVSGSVKAYRLLNALTHIPAKVFCCRINGCRQCKVSSQRVSGQGKVVIVKIFTYALNIFRSRQALLRHFPVDNPKIRHYPVLYELVGVYTFASTEGNDGVVVTGLDCKTVKADVFLTFIRY